MKYYLLLLLFFFTPFCFLHAATINFTTDYYSSTLANKSFTDTDLSFTFCNNTYSIGANFCTNPAFSTFPTYARNMYMTSVLSTPVVANTLIDNAILTGLGDGEYYVIITDNSSIPSDCSGTDIGSCTNTMRLAGILSAVVKVCISGGATVMAEGSCGGGGMIGGVDMGNIVAITLSVATSTTGFDIHRFIETGVSQQLQIVVGEAVNVVYILRYWLAAALIFAVVMVMIRRAKRGFTRHI